MLESILSKNKISYVGWIGQGNIGDEALYLVSKRLLKDYDLSLDCLWSGQNKVQRLIRNYGSKVTFFGGGTIIPLWFTKKANKRRKLNIAFGLGVRNPSFWGDFESSVINDFKKWNLNRISVRGYISQKILSGWGIESEVIGDPVLQLRPKEYKDICKNESVVINIGKSEGKIHGADETRVLKEMIKFCQYLENKGFNLILIPFWSEDVDYMKELHGQLKRATFKNYVKNDIVTDDAISEIMDIISRSNFLVGEKLHSLVLSAACHKPFISLEYRPKCLDFASSVGFEDYNIRTDLLSFETLVEKYMELMKNETAMTDRLTSNVNYFRNKIENFIDLVKRDIQQIYE